MLSFPRACALCRDPEKARSTHSPSTYMYRIQVQVSCGDILSPVCVPLMNMVEVEYCCRSQQSIEVEGMPQACLRPDALQRRQAKSTSTSIVITQTMEIFSISRHSCHMWISLSSLGIPKGFPSFLCNYGKTSLRQLSNGPTPIPAASGRPWTSDEDQKLKDLRQQGLIVRQIANELNRSYAAVDSRIVALKHEAAKHTKKKIYTPWNVEENALMLEKTEQGLTTKQITPFFPGRTFAAVKARHCKVKAAAYSRVQNTSKYTDEFIQRFIDLRLKENKSYPEIAVDLKCSLDTLRKLVPIRVLPNLSKAELNAFRFRTRWSPEEMKHLLELQLRGTMFEDVFLQFPSKSRDAVGLRISRDSLYFPKKSSSSRDWSGHSSCMNRGQQLRKQTSQESK